MAGIRRTNPTSNNDVFLPWVGVGLRAESLKFIYACNMPGQFQFNHVEFMGVGCVSAFQVSEFLGSLEGGVGGWPFRAGIVLSRLQWFSHV